MKRMKTLNLLLFAALFSLFFPSHAFSGKNLNSSEKASHFGCKKELMLYYKPNCPYCVKVTRYLESINQSIPMKNTQNPSVSKELIEIGGKKQVPCLVINGKALYESDAIIAWLKKHKKDL